MIIKYDQVDLEQWALFSGDYNKVHFDNNFALNQGLKDKIVHGMLVMLDAKYLLSNVLSLGNRSLCFYLKSPAYINSPMLFDIAEKKNSSRLTVRDSNKNICFVANASGDFIDIENSSERRSISSGLINKKLNLFKKYYPDINQDWVFIDALAFSLYISDNDEKPLAKETAAYLEKHNIVDSNDVAVYQVDHKINVTDMLWRRRNFDFRKLSYNTRGGGLLRSGDDVYGTVEMNLFEEDKLIYQLSMGLMVKVKN